MNFHCPPLCTAETLVSMRDKPVYPITEGDIRHPAPRKQRPQYAYWPHRRLRCGRGSSKLRTIDPSLLDDNIDHLAQPPPNPLNGDTVTHAEYGGAVCVHCLFCLYGGSNTKFTYVSKQILNLRKYHSHLFMPTVFCFFLILRTLIGLIKFKPI